MRKSRHYLGTSSEKTPFVDTRGAQVPKIQTLFWSRLEGDTIFRKSPVSPALPMSEPLRPSAAPSSRKRSALGNWVDEAAGITMSCCLAALGIVLADRIFRPDWDFSWSDHWKGASILYLAPAALVGFFWAHLRLIQEGVSRRLRGRATRRDWIRAVIVAVIAGAGATPFALRTFSGAKVRHTWLGAAGPVVFVLVVAGAVLVSTLLLWRAQRGVIWGRRRFALTMGSVFVALGCFALWLDMNVYVGLYSHLHVFLELSAFSFFVAAFQLFGHVLVRAFPTLRVVTRALSTALIALGVAFVTYRPLRTWTDSHLAHAWVDEYYVGRTLRRAQLMELSLTSNKTLRVARIEHLARRFGIKDRRLDPVYLKQIDVPPLPTKVRNLLVFYVDTLRADVAHDPELMPEFARFRTQALDFSHTYASGSDTLRSLPTILSGNYFIDRTHEGDLLRLAGKSGHHRRLVLARSANEFLEDLVPTFRFDTTIPVADFSEGEEVWGYGAHLSTARGVVDEGIEFLQSPQAKNPFVLWLFHFDAHAWRELDDGYIKETSERLGIDEEGRVNFRYRVVARAIDEQLGRVLQTLKKTGRDKDTAVVFLSDHGEGLGQGGFWVHSIFLWESLIRVPLALRIPGVEPQSIAQPVSLVDLAPTLAPIFGGARGLYHGQDLLGLAAGNPRRLPILLRGGKFEGHDRVGIVDLKKRRKLVVRLEAAFPELLAYETDLRDDHNLARSEEGSVRSLLKQIARTPVFPRGEADFNLNFEPQEVVSEPAPENGR